MPGAERKRSLIVGAGPTGLTAAVELARRRCCPRIIDRNDGPTPLSKAVGINARSLELLESSGVTERLLAKGIRIRRFRFWRDGRPLAELRFSVLRHRFDFLLSLPQSETEEILEARLAELGVEVERRTELTALRLTGFQAEVTMDGPAGAAERAYDLVLGADGIRSTVRQGLGIAFEGREHERSWSIADARIADWPHGDDAANLFIHAGGDLGFIIPIGPGRYRAISNTADALARIPGGRVEEVLRTDTFRIHVRQVPRYGQGCAFLAGDAAHVHSPAGGRGMNVGIEDACSFARRALDDDLAGYSDERRPRGAQSIAMSERILRAAQATGAVETAVRDLAVRAVGALPFLQRRILSDVMGLR